MTQLRTFAFVRVDPAIKIAVKEQEKAEKEEARRKNQGLENEKEDEGVEQKQKRPSMTSRPSSNGDARRRNGKLASEDENSASLILNPSRASPIESKYLQHIGETLLTTNYSSQELSEDQKAELKRYWPAFTKYFNGTDALEKIPVREQFKRKVVWDELGRMGLFTDNAGTGSGEREEQGKILVGFRHW